MRTAEEILFKHWEMFIEDMNNEDYRYFISNAINEARTEALETAYELAILGNGQAILSLIKELK